MPGQAKVVGVSDGDTIKVLRDGKQVRIRLYGIDAPEKGQPFGSKSKKFTIKFAANKTVEVEPIETDRYGRTVGLVNVYGKSLNKALIRSGYAWVYRDYCKELFCYEWTKLEYIAKKAKTGLWIEPSPIPPWKWRKTKKDKSKSTPAFKGGSGITYHGNISSQVFHRPRCKYYSCRNCTKNFNNRKEAIINGYKPCGICKP
jgi:endonuclease YncB( thermonuclease family)